MIFQQCSAGLSEEPTQTLIDSQSVKTTGAVEQKGFDMEKNERSKKADSHRLYWLLNVTLKKICAWLSRLLCLRSMQIFRFESRKFAWFNHSRRLSKDYELSVNSAQTLIKISHIHTLLKRL